jgi:hypothetical protein
MTVDAAFPHQVAEFHERVLEVDGHEVPYFLNIYYPMWAIFTGLLSTAFPGGSNSSGLWGRFVHVVRTSRPAGGDHGTGEAAKTDGAIASAATTAWEGSQLAEAVAEALEYWFAVARQPGVRCNCGEIAQRLQVTGIVFVRETKRAGEDATVADGEVTNNGDAAVLQEIGTGSGGMAGCGHGADARQDLGL